MSSQNFPCFATWNVRGIGRAEKRRAMKRLIMSTKASLVFIQETKLESHKQWLLRNLWPCKNELLVASPAEGLSGGLVTLWDSSAFEVESKFIQSRSILVTGTLKEMNFKCGFLNIYAPNSEAERQLFFDQIGGILSSISILIMVAGDFNAVLSKEEKFGGSPSQSGMRIFTEFINRNILINISTIGGKYTWARGNPISSASRIDRFLMHPEFVTLYPLLSQSILPRSISDHCPVILKLGGSVRRRRPFKLFSHWMDNSEFSSLVSKTVEKSRGKGADKLLVSLKTEIKSWVAEQKSKEAVSIEDVEKRIDEIENKFVEAKNLSNMDNLIAEMGTLKSKLWDLYRKEGREWNQKSRLKWLLEGDKNTRFFHAVASMRSRSNNIQKLTVGNSTIEDPKAIANQFEVFYKKAYNSSNTVRVKKFERDFLKLNQVDARQIDEPFTQEEVWSAIKATDGTRAPGPDGFNLEFFKRYWTQIKDEIMSLFSDFFECKLSMEKINQSFIALIPKIHAPNVVEDFRPISLVGSLYKVIAKVLAKRLAGCLNDLIGETQFAFLSGRQIADCSFVANELVDYVLKKKESAIVFKADFKKAYDTVDWNFLDYVQMKMGFGSKWRNWIRMCIATARVVVLVNGQPTNSFPISRGLRQGCPLSPMLFNLVGEALSVLIRKGMAIKIVEGIRMGDSNLVISHLQFADDLVLFSMAKEEKVRNIKRVLRIFEIVSGLKLNMKKTKIYGINVKHDVLSAWAASIKCELDTLPTMYLGMPLGHNRNSKTIWDPVLEKFQSRLGGWKG
ncbi:hypothetical protein HRI_003965700 [Hibiscus trionum]|uniref:Reverse transcriptase domain-containing protein n=1 Tax=Hibiscus trionum TaxID=183268 RepID=A0A9W7MKG4_HIBTR|nr:hypothetical protein HRI_003965700 [Hibiscus trionum]